MRRRWHPTPMFLPGKPHRQRSLVGCSPWGCQELDTTERLHFHFSLWCIGEGNGSPLQCSCLGNHRDGGAWWASVYTEGSHRVRHDWSNLAATAAVLRFTSYFEIQQKWNELMDMSLSELHKLLMDREAWCAEIHGVTKSQTRLSDWTELNWMPHAIGFTLLDLVLIRNCTPSKITADGDCSHEIKRRLLLGRKVLTNLDSI